MKQSVLTLALLLAALPAIAEPALTTRAVDLLAQAQSDAAPVTSVPENTKVDILRYSGPWREIKVNGKTGWVRKDGLRLEANPSGATSSRSGGPLSGQMLPGRTYSNATVTTGVKGLQKADLQNARAKPEELKKMERQAVSRDDAQQFAQRSQLSATSVDYLQGSAPVRNAPAADLPGQAGG